MHKDLTQSSIAIILDVTRYDDVKQRWLLFRACSFSWPAWLRERAGSGWLVQPTGFLRILLNCIFMNSKSLFLCSLSCLFAVFGHKVTGWTNLTFSATTTWTSQYEKTFSLWMDIGHWTLPKSIINIKLLQILNAWKVDTSLCTAR